MKHIVAVFVLALAFAAMHPARAQTDVQVVPVLQAPYHLPVFKNDYITMVNIYIPPVAAPASTNTRARPSRSTSKPPT
jgi:hypothetical protein